MDDVFISYQTSCLVRLNILQVSLHIVSIADALYDFSKVLTECQIVSVSREAKIRTFVKVDITDEVSSFFVVGPILEIESLRMNSIRKCPALGSCAMVNVRGFFVEMKRIPT